MFLLASSLYLVGFGVMASFGSTHEIPGVTNHWWYFWLRFCGANLVGFIGFLFGVAVFTETSVGTWAEMLTGAGFALIVMAFQVYLHYRLVPQKNSNTYNGGTAC
jgi:glycopeptide antibiotics resistance protein